MATGADILREVIDEAPTIEVRSFLGWLNDCRWDVRDQGPWLWQGRWRRITPVQVYANGTVATASATMGATDAAFERGMLGATVEVYADEEEESQTMVIQSVTSAVLAVMTTAWAGANQGGGVQITVTQDEWLLPDGVEAGVDKLWRVSGLYPDNAGRPNMDRPLQNPWDYSVEDRDGGGALRLVFRGGAQANTYHLKYWADVSTLTTLDDELGGDATFQRLVRLKMLERVFGLDPGTIEQPSRYTVRLAQVKKEYGEVLAQAKRNNELARGPERRSNFRQF